MPAPLILTLDLDPAAAAQFGDLRRRWFPAARNQLDAHLTLFHALPGDREPEVTAVVRTAARRLPFEVRVTGVRLLGRGVAYDLSAPELGPVRAAVAGAFAGDLTRQDRQPLRAHVTVQNKVEPAVARRLHAELSASFAPWTARATGLSLWWYDGGPWRAAGTAAFDPGP